MTERTETTCTTSDIQEHVKVVRLAPVGEKMTETDARTFARIMQTLARPVLVLLCLCLLGTDWELGIEFCTLMNRVTTLNFFKVVVLFTRYYLRLKLILLHQTPTNPQIPYFSHHPITHSPPIRSITKTPNPLALILIFPSPVHKTPLTPTQTATITSSAVMNSPHSSNTLSNPDRILDPLHEYICTRPRSRRSSIAVCAFKADGR
jgi:hypothetical protein